MIVSALKELTLWSGQPGQERGLQAVLGGCIYTLVSPVKKSISNIQQGIINVQVII
jgi:hypothetical protein